MTTLTQIQKNNMNKIITYYKLIIYKVIAYLLFFLLLLLGKYSAFATTKWILTGDIRGEIKPCGCSELGDLGGIERLSTYFKNQTEKTIWVDLGNYSDKPTQQGTLKSNLIRKMFKMHHVSGILPGPKEFARGIQDIETYQLPYVITNTKKKIQHVNSNISISSNLSLYGYLSSSFLSKGTHKSQYLDDLPNFIKKIQSIKQRKQQILVLLFRGDKQELEQIQAQKIFDQIFVANLEEDEKNQTLNILVNQQTFYKPPIRGQGITLFSSLLSQKPPKTIWLDKNIPSDVSWKKDFEEYNAKVKKIFLKDLAKKRKKVHETLYQGASNCIACHQKEGKVWKKSKHAKAWDILVKIGKDFDPECIVCHSVGFEKGGFLTFKDTPNLANVQCENCHGPVPKNHFQIPNFKKERKKVKVEDCQTCHRGAHSPEFTFESYWPKITH